MRAGPDAPLRHLRHRQAYLPGLHHPVRRNGSAESDSLPDHSGARERGDGRRHRGDGTYTDFEGVPLQVGDRVIVGANVICGECYYCTHDFPYYFCERMVDYGHNMTAAEPPHLFGGWSEYLYVVPGSFLVRVPDDLPDDVAVLTEVMAVTVGLDRAKQFSAVPNESFRFDDTVVVLGVGPLGMCFLMKARMLGAGTIVAVDLSAYRLSMAERLGADAAIDASRTT